jgi:hypothetical protein
MRRKNNVILAGKDIYVIDITKNSARFYGPGQTTAVSCAALSRAGSA